MYGTIKSRSQSTMLTLSWFYLNHESMDWVYMTETPVMKDLTVGSY